MVLELSSRVDAGSKNIWLSKGGFIQFIMIDESINQAAAELRWAEEIAKAPDGRVTADKQRLLYPVEKFVYNYESRAQTERMELGGRVCT